PDARAEEPRDEEEDRRGRLRQAAEANAEELVDRRAVELVERRDEEKRDRQPRRHRAKKDLKVLPVLPKRRRRNGDDRHRAHLGRDERQASRPNRNRPPPQKELLGRRLPLLEQQAYAHHREQENPEDDEVLPPDEGLAPDCGHAEVGSPFLEEVKLGRSGGSRLNPAREKREISSLDRAAQLATIGG